MQPIHVHGVGFATPGLADWPAARAALRGHGAYTPVPLPVFRTALLPRNESRRAGRGVNLAFRVAEAACSGFDASRFAAVFASAVGDIDIADSLCSDVNTPQRTISPTRFHNSVHNAAVGYWSIATGSHETATSLSGGIGGFVTALREAWGLVIEGPAPVLLVSFDMDGVGLLHAARPDIGGSCAAAWLLSRHAEGALASLSHPAISAAAADRLADPGLEALRRVNPTARSLPLFDALARGESRRVVIESEQGDLGVDVASHGRDTP